MTIHRHKNVNFGEV